jgi:purine-binding chemotaxis protein CheW
MAKPTQNSAADTAAATAPLAVEIAREEASETRQFVTFIAGNEVFAVDMAPVQEIIRVPDVVRVPLAPPTLDGLANLRGRVLPIISLRRLFGFEELAHDDSTRAVVIDIGQPLGFVVDRVASVIGVEPSQIEGVEGISSSVNTDLLSGIIKDSGEHEMIMVLDFEKLILREFTKIAAMANNAGVANAIATATEQEALVESSDELQLVSFDVAEQEYAINIEDVQEIVQVPDTIIHVPHSKSHSLGIMTLRNRLLPIVCLRRMFGLSTRDLDESSRIVVLTLEGASVGVAVDGVSEVLRVAKAHVDSMPPLLAREGDLADITEICRLDDGKRLVSIITARNLFDHSSVKEALRNMSEIEQGNIEETAVLDESLGDDEQLVIFLLDKEEFGVPIDSVQEIVRVPEDLTRVPHSPSFVEGVVNLRGSVLPVIDLRLKLGLDQVARSDRQRIMVFLLNGLRTGFIVDHVAEVLRIAKSAIEPAPQLSNEQGQMLTRMANLEKQKRMVQLIEPAHLIAADELKALASVAKK